MAPPPVPTPGKLPAWSGRPPLRLSPTISRKRRSSPKSRMRMIASRRKYKLHNSQTAVYEQFDDRTQQHEASSLGDRKSTRLNSSHPSISYAVFCLKKKNKN